MRLSTSLIYSNGLKGILNQESQVSRLTEMIGSGKSFLSPADNPLAASRAINMTQTQAMNTTYAANRSTANTNLGQESNVLDTLNTTMQDLMTRVVQAGNGTLSDTDRAALSTVLTNTREALLALANSTDGNGQYLFSGNQGSVAPYTVDASGKVQWGNMSGSRDIQVDQSRQISSGDLGVDIFGRANPGALEYITSASGTNTGTGQIGSPSVTAGGASVGMNFTVAFEDDGAGGVAYRVTVTDPSQPTGPGNPVTTPDPALPATPYTDGATVDIGGVAVKLTGAPAAGDEFSVSTAATSDMDIFATLDELISTLDSSISGDPVASAKLNNVLATANQKLSNNYDNLQTVRASVGSRQNELDALDSTGNQKGLGYTAALSEIQDLDYYSAASELAMRQVALQAASASFTAIQGSSLFSRN